MMAKRMTIAAMAGLAALIAPAAIATAWAQDEAAEPERPQWSWPDGLENAQILPEDMPAERLRGTMVFFVRSLGVRCSFCHVGDGPDLSTYDFASDDNPRKDQARRMMRMVGAINREHLADWDGPGQSARVTCHSCHGGQRIPSLMPPEEES